MFALLFQSLIVVSSFIMVYIHENMSFVAKFVSHLCIASLYRIFVSHPIITCHSILNSECVHDNITKSTACCVIMHVSIHLQTNIAPTYFE